MGFLTMRPESVDPTQAAMESHGYLIEVMHLGSGKTCTFPSWLTEYSDNYTSEWKSERIFGRNDPIGSFTGVSRKISLALEVPSFSVEEARENLHQLEHLFANLYPSYKVNHSVQVMTAYPLVKVRFSNLIKSARFKKNGNDVKLGLAGWIENVSYSPVLEAGFHHPPAGQTAPDPEAQSNLDFSAANIYEDYKDNESHTFYPKTLKFSFSLSVVHEHALGWNGKSWLSVDGKGPYTGITLSGGQHDDDDTPGSKGFARGMDKAAIQKEVKKRVGNILGPNV